MVGVAVHFGYRLRLWESTRDPSRLPGLSVAEREIGVICPHQSPAKAHLKTVGRKPRGFESHPLRQAFHARYETWTTLSG